VCAALLGCLLLLAGCGGPGARGTAGDSGSGSAGAGPDAPEAPTRSATSLPYRADWAGGLGGWTTSKDWSVLNGQLLSAGQDGGTEAGALAPVDLSAVTDYAVEAEIKFVRETFGYGRYGVMVRIQEDGPGYTFGHNEGNVVLGLSNGTGLDRQAYTPGNEWHTYRIEVRGNELHTFVDGSPTVSATDNTFLRGKRVGLYTQGAQISVRRFEVTTL
jgi:hypothetical protein